MDFKIILVLLAVVVGAVAFGWLTSGGGPVGSGNAQIPASPVPVILGIEFPENIPANGGEVMGRVRFADPNGDLVLARFELVDAIAFEGFTIDLTGAEGIERGNFTFTLFSQLAQEVRMQVVLVDAAGHESKPQAFSFVAVSTEGP